MGNHQDDMLTSSTLSYILLVLHVSTPASDAAQCVHVHLRRYLHLGNRAGHEISQKVRR